jgi:hypothetical protein
VDTGALDSDSGDTNSGDPDSPNQGEPPIAGPLGLYVDDMLVLGRDPQAIQKVINGIASLWEIKDLGKVALILGIRVHRDRMKHTLFLN